MIESCHNFYRPEAIRLLEEADIKWVWITWSVGFSPASEEKQQAIVNRFIRLCHDKDIKVSAYMSLTNMFWEDMFREVPASKSWTQQGENGKPIPYGAASYGITGKVTRYLAYLNRTEWRDLLKVRVKKAIE